jgi:hypothetical protein
MSLDENILDGLPDEKKELLRICTKWADKIYKVQFPKSRSIWKFEFDEGVYQGATVCSIKQSDLSPLSVLNMLHGVNWPGFNAFVGKANLAIMEIFKQDNEK